MHRLLMSLNRIRLLPSTYMELEGWVGGISMGHLFHSPFDYRERVFLEHFKETVLGQLKLN